MLISLWGAEPKQINSSERIMAQADIKPLPFTPLKHTFSSHYSHKGRQGGEGMKGSGGRSVIMSMWGVWQRSKQSQGKKRGRWNGRAKCGSGNYANINAQVGHFRRKQLILRKGVGVSIDTKMNVALGWYWRDDINSFVFIFWVFLMVFCVLPNLQP